MIETKLNQDNLRPNKCKIYQRGLVLVCSDAQNVQ